MSSNFLLRNEVLLVRFCSTSSCTVSYSAASTLVSVLLARYYVLSQSDVCFKMFATWKIENRFSETAKSCAKEFPRVSGMTKPYKQAAQPLAPAVPPLVLVAQPGSCFVLKHCDDAIFPLVKTRQRSSISAIPAAAATTATATILST